MFRDMQRAAVESGLVEGREMDFKPGPDRCGSSGVEARLPMLRPGRTTPTLRARLTRRRTGPTRIARILGLAGLLAGLFQPFGAMAQEVSLLAGSISSLSDWPRSYAWSFSYRHVWRDYFSTTVAYLNQGHFPGHHRDGVTGEAWAQMDLFDNQLTLAIGAGPFNYYDTTVAARGGGYSDNHGWAWLYSAGATWQPEKKGWFAELRIDRTSPAQSIETTSVTAGVGYRLQPDSRGHSSRADPVYDQSELTLFYGKTVVNSFSSQEARAEAAEFRHAFGDYARASIAFVNEGDAQLIRRNGAIVEGWLEPGFFSGRYSVGIGAGVYSAIDKYQPTVGRHLSGIVTLTMSYRVFDHLDARFNWHRIVTDYDRDTDIVLYGLGYRF
jgi:hypothetical protein